MSGHTPGPWSAGQIRESGWVGILSAEDRLSVAFATPAAPGSAEERRDAETVANARLIAAAPTGLAAAEEVYLALLRHPHDTWRLHNQRTLCLLRDFIAEATGQSEQAVQGAFEERAFLTRTGAAP